MDKKYNDLIGDILDAAGEKDHFRKREKGKSLPKSYMEKDLFQNFQEKAKEAGFLPAWLALQKEIAQLIQVAKTEHDVDTINEKVKKYNVICPPPMQKPPITFEHLNNAKQKWTF